MDEKMEKAKQSGCSKSSDEEISPVQMLSNNLIPHVLSCIKNAGVLPTEGVDYDYLLSFESYRSLLAYESKRLLMFIHKLLQHQGAKGGIQRSTSIEDQFDFLVDANDQLLERVGMFLDEASGIKKKSEIVATTVMPRSICGSWNRNVLQRPEDTEDNVVSLLANRQVDRPQKKFKDVIDNSRHAFVPQLQRKPHSSSPIPEQILLAQQSKTSKIFDENCPEPSLLHPYEDELHQFKVDESFLDVPDSPVKPAPLESTPFTFVEVLEELEEMKEHLLGQTEIAVDLEHHSYRTYQGFVCLMQVSSRSRDFVVDTLKLREHICILDEIFANPMIVKIFHGAQSDIVWLQRDFGIYVVNLFDTFHASHVLELPRFSLAYLLLTICEFSANKQYQLADWRIRPLPEELIMYARHDTHSLLYIYDVLKKQLAEKGGLPFLHLVWNNSRITCLQSYEKPQLMSIDHHHFRHVNFDVRQKETLSLLLKWRDDLAREQDESTGFVMSNQMVLQVAKHMPVDCQGILALCKPTPPLLRQNLSEIAALISEGRRAVFEKVAAPAPAPLPLPAAVEQTKKAIFCPHDESKKGSKKLRIPPMSSPVSSDISVKPVENSLMYSTNMHVLDDSSADDAEGIIAKVRLINDDYINPILKFLPKNLLSEENERVLKSANPLPLNHPYALSRLPWQLKPNSISLPLKSIDYLASIERLKKSVKEPEDLPVVLNKISKKKKRKLNNPHIPSEELSEPICSTKKLTMEDVEEYFEPHKYQEAEAALPAGGKDDSQRKKKKKFVREFDPEAEALKFEMEFKKPRRPGTNPKSGRRGMTFSTKNLAKVVPAWPKVEKRN